MKNIPKKSSKKLSTLNTHMTNDTKLQLHQNAMTNRLIIPCLSTANSNPINGELYYDTIYFHSYIYCNGWVQITNILK